MLTSQNNDPRWILATIVESGNHRFWGWHKLCFVTFFLLLFFLRIFAPENSPVQPLPVYDRYCSPTFLKVAHALFMLLPPKTTTLLLKTTRPRKASTSPCRLWARSHSYGGQATKHFIPSKHPNLYSEYVMPQKLP